MFTVPSEPIVTFGCPECGGKLTVPAELLGVTGPCPLCRREITAPQRSAPEIPFGVCAPPGVPQRHPARRTKPAASSTRNGSRIRPFNNRRESRLPAASVHPRENPEARDSEGEGGNVDGTAWRLPIGCDARRIEFPPPITGKASARKQPSASENSTGDLPGFRSMELSESRLRRRASSEHAAVSGWGRAFLFGLLLVLVAGVIPIAGVHFYRSATGATQVASERTEAYASDRREVLMRLRAFHEADSPEAKAAFVAGGAEGVEEMRAYYEQHPPEPSMYVVDPTLEFFERSGIPAVRGTGRYSGAEPFVFEFSKRNGEWFLDWNRFKEADRLAHNG